MNNTAPQKPKIELESEKSTFYPLAGHEFSLSYNVTSKPDSNIEWWRSKDGVEYQRYASFAAGKYDEKYEMISCNNKIKGYVTRTRFKIDNLRFPGDNFYYKCNASSNYGSDSKVFQLQIYGNVIKIFAFIIALKIDIYFIQKYIEFVTHK